MRSGTSNASKKKNEPVILTGLRINVPDPGDPRKVERVVFVRRRIFFPEPNQTYDDVDPPSERDIVSFTPEGKLLP